MQSKKPWRPNPKLEEIAVVVARVELIPADRPLTSGEIRMLDSLAARVRAQLGAALGASRAQVVRDVVVPAALPETFTGIRLAVGMAYSSVVAAELFNGIPGIGGLVKDASNYNNTPVVLVGIFAIGFSGLVIDGLLRAIEVRAVPWRGKL